MGSNNYFWFFDNQDDKLVGKKGWIQDWLATLSTGKEISKRKMYTDDQTFRKIPKGFPAITSRTPHYRRDDIADRLLIIEVERRNNLIPEGNFFDEFIKKRDMIWAVILQELQLILKALTNKNKFNTQFRMADFASFAFRITPRDELCDQIDSVFKKLAFKQSEFTTELDPIFQSLEIWINESNVQSEISSGDLFKKLCELAEKERITGFPKSAKSFGMKFKQKLSDYKKFYEINKSKGKGNITFYNISLKKE